MLRQELAYRIDRSVCVRAVPTGDITCGFFIIDGITGDIVWTGDGFRTDGGGEGGRGYEAAKQILKTFSLREGRDWFLMDDKINFSSYESKDVVDAILKFSEKHFDGTILENEYVFLNKRNVEYNFWL